MARVLPFQELNLQRSGEVVAHTGTRTAMRTSAASLYVLPLGFGA